jgi:cysteine sulfinate desulfinase/cysteine desulfurase-like protein
VAEIQSRSSLLTGLLAVTGAGLYALDGSGAVNVDEAVTLASLLVLVGAAGVTRSVTALLHRLVRD